MSQMSAYIRGRCAASLAAPPRAQRCRGPAAAHTWPRAGSQRRHLPRATAKPEADIQQEEGSGSVLGASLLVAGTAVGAGGRVGWHATVRGRAGRSGGQCLLRGITLASCSQHTWLASMLTHPRRPRRHPAPPGVLALPAVTQDSGFVASAVALAGGSAYSVAIGLLLAELYVNSVGDGAAQGGDGGGGEGGGSGSVAFANIARKCAGRRAGRIDSAARDCARASLHAVSCIVYVLMP